jgi:hypothetical protein
MQLWWHITPRSRVASILRDGLDSTARSHEQVNRQSIAGIYVFASADDAISWGALYWLDEYGIEGDTGMDLIAIDGTGLPVIADPASDFHPPDDDLPPSAQLCNALIARASVITQDCIDPQRLTRHPGFAGPDHGEIVERAYIAEGLIDDPDVGELSW